MLKEIKFDVVIVVMLNYFYVDVIIKVLKEGVYVFCEKLMVIIEDECRMMVEIVKEMGKFLMIVYN